MRRGAAVTLFERLKSWAKALKRDVLALWIAARDPRTPLIPKVTAGLIAAYALSPIDLIPDFIPVLGYLDELILLPLAIALVIRLVPAELMAEFRAEAGRRSERPVSRMAAFIIIAVWLLGHRHGSALVLALHKQLTQCSNSAASVLNCGQIVAQQARPAPLLYATTFKMNGS